MQAGRCENDPPYFHMNHDLWDRSFAREHWFSRIAHVYIHAGDNRDALPTAQPPPAPPLRRSQRYENASVFHQTEWVDVDTITINLAGNVVLLLLALTYFWSSRRHHPSCFSSKRYFLPEQTPPDLPTCGFLSWIM